jgi:hypothetical protein
MKANNFYFIEHRRTKNLDTNLEPENGFEYNFETCFVSSKPQPQSVVFKMAALPQTEFRHRLSGFGSFIEFDSFNDPYC